MADSLTRITRELRARHDELAPLVSEFERIKGALSRLGAMTEQTERPRRTRARRAPAVRLTDAQVRDGVYALRDFNLRELSEHLGTTNRGRVGQIVAELVERGTVRRYGGKLGPSVRWCMVEQEHAELVAERNGSDREPGWKANGVVPHTGVVGPADKPLKLRRQQQRGAKVKVKKVA